MQAKRLFTVLSYRNRNYESIVMSARLSLLDKRADGERHQAHSVEEVVRRVRDISTAGAARSEVDLGRSLARADARFARARKTNGPRRQSSALVETSQRLFVTRAPITLQ